jgi:hypothetical protein
VAATVADLAIKPWVAVANGGAPVPASGQFIEVRATLTRPTGTTLSPILYDLTVTCSDSAPPVTSCICQGTASSSIYTLRAADVCDPNPFIFIVDTGSGQIFGPFLSGDRVVVRRNPLQPPYFAPMPGYAGRVQVQEKALIFAKDASGNLSTPLACPH